MPLVFLCLWLCSLGAAVTNRRIDVSVIAGSSDRHGFGEAVDRAAIPQYLLFRVSKKSQAGLGHNP